jgi:hypothetical protein
MRVGNRTLDFFQEKMYAELSVIVQAFLVPYMGRWSITYHKLYKSLAGRKALCFSTVSVSTKDCLFQRSLVTPDPQGCLPGCCLREQAAHESIDLLTGLVPAHRKIVSDVVPLFPRVLRILRHLYAPLLGPRKQGAKI